MSCTLFLPSVRYQIGISAIATKPEILISSYKMNLGVELHGHHTLCNNLQES